MKKNIDNLLEKYFEGETSLQEEQILRDYFTQGNVADEHKTYAPMFCFFEQERDLLQAKSKQPLVIKKKKNRLIYLTVSAVAACLIIFISIRMNYIFGTDSSTKSLVYIDGKKTTDINTIRNQALISIENVSENDKDMINSQIEILDSFIE